MNFTLAFKTLNITISSSRNVDFTLDIAAGFPKIRLGFMLES